MSDTPLVVVVDDDDAVRKSLTRLLQAAHLEILTFGGAQAVLEAALPDRPICMIVDQRMPQMSGLELQDALRRAGRPAHMVFLSAHGDVATATHAMKSGAVDFLQKPVDEDQLLQAVERAISRARRMREDDRRRRDVDARLAGLTSRERQVLTYVVSGWLNKQIAAELGVTEKTVKVHRARVMTKMDADSLADLVRMAEAAEITVLRPDPRRAHAAPARMHPDELRTLP
jgi:RNA polymerase sigma factor (sigma-70 family)